MPIISGGSSSGGSSSGGDMAKAVYDPALQEEQVLTVTSSLNLANAVEAANANLLTDAELSKLNGITAGAEVNTASNVGAGGMTLFKQKTGSNLEFKNLNIGSNKITLANDVANNEIDIDVSENSFSIGSRLDPLVAFIHTRFVTDVTETDPGPGNCKFNSATVGSITKFMVDLVDVANLTLIYEVPKFKIGDRLIMVDASTHTTVFGSFLLTTTATDNSGWFIMTGTPSMTSLPTNNQLVDVIHISNSSKTGILSTITLDDLAGTIATAQIELNAVGNARQAKMPLGTVKVNNTLALADPVDMLLPDNTLMVSDNTGTLKAMDLGPKITIVGDIFDVTPPSEAEVLVAGDFVRYDADGDPIDILGAKLNVVPSYTWALKPAAASNADKWIYITDVGQEKNLWKSNGTRWIPQNRQLDLFRGSWGTVATPSLSRTTVGKFNIGTDPVLPAGFLQVGDTLEAQVVIRVSGATAGSDIFRIHLGTSATPTSNSLFYGVTPAAADDHGVIGEPIAFVTSSTTYTTTSRLTKGGQGTVGLIEDQTTLFDIASAMTFTANLTANASGEAMNLHYLRIIYRC